jgi:hypothetical protein
LFHYCVTIADYCIKPRELIEENGDWLAVPRFRHHHRQPRGSFLVTNTEEAQLVKKNNSRSIDQVQ